MALAMESGGRFRLVARATGLSFGLSLGLAFGLAAALLVSAAPPASADVVVTNDGTTYEGKVVSQDDQKVVVETTFEGTKELPRSAVKSVDTTVPPLRFQLGYRLEQAGKDVHALLDVLAWAKSKGFSKDLDVIWIKVLEADPKNVKAHKALGHVFEGGKWMTAEEKAKRDKEMEEAQHRAKGLVPYEGRWVTPEEKAALEKGLVRDGNDWVTEEEFHARRGETKVDGAWVRVGEAEAKARAEKLSKQLGATLTALWSPHVDVFHELRPEDAEAVRVGAEKAWDAFAAVLRPGEGDKLRGLRVQVFLFEKAPAYARHVEAFGKEVDSESQSPGWSKSVTRQTSWWWLQTTPAVSAYLFPNTPKALTSRIAHSLSYVWLDLYHRKRFANLWLQEGVAYAVELRALGYSQAYTVGKSGSAGTDPAIWQDAGKWKDSLRALVAASQDTPAGSMLKVPFTGGFSLPDLVKAWSLVEFLLKKDPAKFKALVDATTIRAKPTEPERTDEDALREVYGMDGRALESAWRAWAQAGFP